jgi:hypothetical protein
MKTTIERAAKKQRAKRQEAQRAHEDPRMELRLLVRRRMELIRTRNRLANMTRERTVRKDCPALNWKQGDKLPPSLSEDLCLTIAGFIEQLERPSKEGLSAMGGDSRYDTINEAEAGIRMELRKLVASGTPDGSIASFLLGIHGLGEITTAELVVAIDFHKCVKPSQLMRFCGMGHSGPPGKRRLDCKANAEGKLKYSSVLRTALWNAAESMARGSTIAGMGVGSKWRTKYTDAWARCAEREQFSPRLLAEHNLFDTDLVGANADRVRSGEMSVKAAKAELKKRDGLFRSAAGFIRSKGRWKMVDAILYDLYLVGRAAHGLPVYCTWHEKARQRAHGTDEHIDQNAPPRLLTLAEALAAVGETGKIAVPMAAE